MKRDTILISLIVGAVATTVDIVISILLKLTGLIKTPLFLYVAKLSLVDVSAPQWILYSIGIMTHLGVGALFAFVFVLLLRKWGKDYLLIKGAAYGLSVLWLLRVVLIPNFITSDIKLKQSATSQPFHILTSIIWGLIAAYTYDLITSKYLKAK